MDKYIAKHFNPRCPQGSDNEAMQNVKDYLLFQSTLPARQRPCARDSGCLYHDFNPRCPQGSDGVVNDFYVRYADISIHAARKAATTTAVS